MPKLTDLADQKDVVDAFKTALVRIKGDAVKALHRNARKSVATLAALFEAERFANTARESVFLGRISRAWRKRKIALGMDTRRGHFTGTLAKAIKSPTAITKDEKGFTYDIRLSSGQAKVKGRAKAKGVRRRRARKTPLNRYVRFYEKSKARGLGTIPKSGIGILDAAVAKAIAKKLKNVKKSAQRPGTEFRIDIELKLGGFKV